MFKKTDALVVFETLRNQSIDTDYIVIVRKFGMYLMRRLIPIVLVCLPATGWSANLNYALDVTINTIERKITGYARLKADADRQIRLSVVNLHQLKVNGNPVNIDRDETISLTFQQGKDVCISYEIFSIDQQTNWLDKENVFLTDKWYPRPNTLAEYSLTVTLPKDFIAVSESDEVTVQKEGPTKTYDFRFNHSVDGVHLAAGP